MIDGDCQENFVVGVVRGSAGPESRSNLNALHGPLAVQFHDILYKTFRDILYTPARKCRRWSGKKQPRPEGEGWHAGRGRAAHEICGGGESQGEDFDRAVCRIRDLAAHWVWLAEAVSDARHHRDARGKPASPSQSGENGGGG